MGNNFHPGHLIDASGGESYFYQWSNSWNINRTV